MAIGPKSVLAARFVVEARAGGGGMSTVFRATDRETGAPVAIKVLDASAMTDASAPRFAREIRLLRGLDHPGIVRYVSDGAIDDGLLFLAMEWLDGEDLATHLARDRGGALMPIDDVLAIAKGTAAALSAAHARGVVHRDVKPSNLLLVDGDPQRVKVLDFGVACETALEAGTEAGARIRPVTRTGAILGTVGYMAPEQARGDHVVDARADVFSLGCVLFECLTGRPAFVGSHVVAVLAKILLEDAPRASALRHDVPPELDALLVRMLAKDATARPPDAAAIARALEAIATTTPSRRAPPEGPSASVPAFADREQRLVTIVLAQTSDVAAARAHVASFGGEVHPLADRTMLLVAFTAGDGLATDHVVRAASCALALAPRVDAVAIATGRVEATGDGRMGPIVDRVVRMSREEAPRPDANAAGRGTPPRVLIDAVSAGLLDGRFDVRALAPRDDGEARYLLYGLTRDRIGPRTLLGRITPCVGRSKELTLLEATFRECAEEPIARLCLVTGPSGVGKSRLCYELIARLSPRVLVARGDPVGAGAALALVRQLVGAAVMGSSSRADANAAAPTVATTTDVATTSFLDDHLREILPEPAQAALRERIGDMLRELLALPPTCAPGPEVRAARNDPAIMSGALRRAFDEWLAAVARRSPLLLVLEDMHWGDAASISFIEGTLERHPDLPILVLGLARPEVHEVFPRFRSSAMDASENVQEIRLPVLTKSAAAELVRSALGEAPPDTVARIIARAEGNAFYLEELVRHVVERSDQSMPATVLAVAAARIESLDAEARRVLRVASVFGDVFPSSGVASLLSARAADTVEGTLRELVRRELLVERESVGTRSTTSFAFRHALLRDAAYAMLTDEDRVEAHLRAGNYLERATDASPPLVLAEHFERGGDVARALPHIARAARLASDVGAFASAAALGVRGIALGATGETRAHLRIAQAVAGTSAGDFSNVVEWCKEALPELPKGGLDWFITLGAMLQAATRSADLSTIPMAMTELLSLEADPEPIGPYAFATYVMIDVLDTIDQGEIATTLLERAESVAKAKGREADPMFVGAIANARVNHDLVRDRDIGHVIASAERARVALADVSNPMTMYWLATWEGILAVELGDYDLGESALHRAANVIAREGSALFAAWCRIHRAWICLSRGEPARVLALVEDLHESPDARHVKALAAMAHLALGHHDDADRLSAAAVHGLEYELITPWVVTILNAVRAKVLVARGRPQEGLIHARTPIARTGANISPTTIALLVRMEAERAAGDLEAARDVARTAHARIERHAASLPEHWRSRFRSTTWNAQTSALAQELLGTVSATPESRL